MLTLAANITKTAKTSHPKRWQPISALNLLLGDGFGIALMGRIED
jgi:hypothetical protein